MALSTFAEWSGSAIISNLVDTAYSYLGERLLPADTEADLNRLKFALPKIKAVMNVSEALKFKYPNSGVIEWLNNFKLAFLAADDVLDELEYRELEDRVHDQVSASSSSILGSLKRKFPGSNINSGTLEKLREAVQMLDLATTNVGDFIQFVNALNGTLESHYDANLISNRESSSFLTGTKVFGRDNEKAWVIEWLKKPISQTQISALCIVGAGGLGKTTLAQLIFEDISRENHFDEIIWVCVSTCFRVEDITRKILQNLSESSHVGESLNSLQLKLKKKVHSKKVFLILDDVWNDNKIHDWEKLVAPLKFVQQGSKILLTTRMKSVGDMLASVLNVKREYLDLRGLEEPELLQLLNKYAFHGYNPDSHKDLQKIGNDIVKKLWGSPLAAKVIGNLLNSNMYFDYWTSILKYNSLINLEQAENVADVLQLSYYHLSADLQECFRFCSIFPQDYLFEKNELIRMWVASGLISKQSCLEERVENIGEKYLNRLLRKSFFERHPLYENNYIMHDLMHELAKNVSKGECFRVEANEKSVNIPITAQHVSIPECEVEMVFHLRNLRTLIITMSKYKMFNHLYILPNSSLKQTLRILKIDVRRRGCQLPEEIGSLIHLRYLKALLGSKPLLPHSIYKLYHLQVLELYGEKFETIGMTNLVSLCHMNLPSKIIKNIKGLHKLTSLEELAFYVGHDKGHHIDELKTLNNLRDLSIMNIENVSDPAEAKNAQLFKKKNLTSLSLQWTHGSKCDNPEQIIDNLQPSSSLRILTIQYYEGRRSPMWMRDSTPLDYLSSVKLFNCPFWEGLPIFAQMPHLKALSLIRMSEVKEVGYSIDSTRNAFAFPSLEQLYCCNMPKWQLWSGHLHNHGFPNLKQLEILDCPVLAELPAMSLSLSEFTVRNVGLSFLPDMYHNSSNNTPAPSSLKSSLKEVVIQNCPNLKSLTNGFLQQDNIDLLGLERLTIDACENLVQLPTNAFGKFGSLKDLHISANPKLVAVNNQRIVLPVELQSLYFGNCGELDMPLLELASHLTALQQLCIEKSESITHIPFIQNAFASLSMLDIHGCDKLIEHSAMEYAQGVNPGNNMNSLRIRKLKIPHLSLLFIEPLRSLRFVRECQVIDCSGMEALPEQWLLQNSNTLEVLRIHNARFLRSLPDTMVMLTVLRQLEIKNADLLEEIPELPTTLKVLRIHNASLLRSLPGTMVRLTNLNELLIYGANFLEEIPELPATLEVLCIYNASSLRSLPGSMVKLTALRRLEINNANLLQEIPELPSSLSYKKIEGFGGRRMV